MSTSADGARESIQAGTVTWFDAEGRRVAGPPLPDDPDDLVRERGKTHGNFRTTAAEIQRLKVVMRDTYGWARLTPVQRECLDCIAIKIGRILSGDASHHDHWNDIAGYARLAVTPK